MKNDDEECFAMKNGSCMILTDEYPKCNNCAFKKTRKQFDDDLMKANKRLKSFDTIKFMRIKAAYYKKAKGEDLK